MINKKALNIELLEFAGFTCTGGIWSYPDGVDVDNGVPFFPESLDECFKWLTPKVLPMLADIDLSTEREAWYKLVGLWLEEPNPPSALALCLAIRKLYCKKCAMGVQDENTADTRRGTSHYHSPRKTAPAR